MVELSRDDLFTLEEYSEKRSSFRSGVLDEKKNRGVMVGNHVHLIFENKNTIQYQVQEMLRIEKIFEAKDIQEELDAYNPLIPEGKNLKATMLIEYVDVEIRREELTKLKGIERNVWFKVGDTEKVYGIADEDLEREDDTKTSAVHFMRFEFNETQIAKFKNGAGVLVGIDHDYYDVPPTTLHHDVVNALASDFS